MNFLKDIFLLLFEHACTKTTIYKLTYLTVLRLTEEGINHTGSQMIVENTSTLKILLR